MLTIITGGAAGAYYLYTKRPPVAARKALVSGLEVMGATVEPGPVQIVATIKNTGNVGTKYAVAFWLMDGWYTGHSQKADTVSCAEILPAAGNWYAEGGGTTPYHTDDFVCTPVIPSGESFQVTRLFNIPPDEATKSVLCTVYPYDKVNQPPLHTKLLENVLTHPAKVAGEITSLLVS